MSACITSVYALLQAVRPVKIRRGEAERTAGADAHDAAPPSPSHGRAPTHAPPHEPNQAPRPRSARPRAMQLGKAPQHPAGWSSRVRLAAAGSVTGQPQYTRGQVP